jgi:hypothetical protein
MGSLWDKLSENARMRQAVRDRSMHTTAQWVSNFAPMVRLAFLLLIFLGK